MSRVVVKYPLPALGVMHDITMDAEAKPLHVAEQHGKICLWAEINTQRPTAVRTFIIIGTEHPFEFFGQHIGAVPVMSAQYVWHVYEVIQP